MLNRNESAAAITAMTEYYDPADDCRDRDFEHKCFMHEIEANEAVIAESFCGFESYEVFKHFADKVLDRICAREAEISAGLYFTPVLDEELSDQERLAVDFLVTYDMVWRLTSPSGYVYYEPMSEDIDDDL